MATRKRTRRIDLRVERTIHELADRGASPSQIHRELGRDPESIAELPNLRTVQRVVREHVQADDSGSWELDVKAGADAAAVVEVLATVVSITGGVTRAVTNLEAAWVKTLASIAPDLDPWRTYRAARVYIARRARNESTLDLEVWLGLAPWRAGRRERYEELIADGVVPRSPVDSTAHAQLAPVFREAFEEGGSLEVSEIGRRLAEVSVDDPDVALAVVKIRELLNLGNEPE
jgi:hypothetical protein